jgi:hypothetical protein
MWKDSDDTTTGLQVEIDCQLRVYAWKKKGDENLLRKRTFFLPW